MTSKKLKDFRKELLDKYSEKMTGYEHLDDGTGDYARTVLKNSEKESEEKSEKTWHSCQELVQYKWKWRKWFFIIINLRYGVTVWVWIMVKSRWN